MLFTHLFATLSWALATIFVVCSPTTGSPINVKERTSEENWKNSRDQDNQLETATFPDLPAVMENYREIPEDIVKFLHSEQKLQEALRNLMFATQETVIPRLLEAHDHEQRALRNRKLNTLHKRGLDFGTNRGYAGSVAARYLMGLALANSPSGPGKK